MGNISLASMNTELSPEMFSLVNTLCAQVNSANMTPEALQVLIGGFEELTEKQKILADLKKDKGEPRKGTGKDDRWFWRPIKGDKTKIFRGKTKEEVEQKALGYVLGLKNNTEMTLLKCLESYNASRNDICDSTRVRNIQILKKFAGTLIDAPICSITSLQLRNAYVDAIIASQAKQKACNNYRSVINQIFTHAEEDLKLNVVSPTEIIKKLNKINQDIITKPDEDDLGDDIVVRRYTNSELIKLIEICKKRDTLKSLAVALSAFTGVRISELCALRKTDITREIHRIHIQIAAKENAATKQHYLGLPKKGRKRKVYYPDQCVEIIDRIFELSDPDSEFLFQNTNNRKKVCEWMTKKQVDHEIRVICKILGIIPKSSHDIRRTYASILDENGVPTALRKKLMGHSLTPMEKSYLVDGFSAKEIVIIMTGVYSKVLDNKVLAA